MPETSSFSFKTIADLLAALDEEDGVSLGNKHYELMAKLDGKKTSNGLQHQFRAVKKRAKELQSEIAKAKATASAKKVCKGMVSTPVKRDRIAAKIDSDGEKKEPISVRKPKKGVPDLKSVTKDKVEIDAAYDDFYASVVDDEN